MDRRRLLGLLIGGAALGADTPWLRASDRRAFRGWFTFLAEAPCFMEEGTRPAEIRDCSSLIRFAYREALRAHTAEWAAGCGVKWAPPLAEVSAEARKYLLFAVEDRARRHFADAEHLMRFNCFRVTREARQAEPGDLFFYRQGESQAGWHSMVFVGRSVVEGRGEARVVYHTGPEGKWAGELRRPTLAELMRHEEPRWRPVAGNGHFLGVYRWNLLRESE